MTLFTPGILNIKGKRCLIIADSVGHALPASKTVLLEQVEGFSIFCLTEELIEKKAIYRGVPIYGYWQTLYASKQWRPDNGIFAYKHNHIGQYVAVDLDEKTAVTGEVVDGRAVATVGEQLNTHQIQWLEVNIDDITLPDRSAMTMAEQIATREQKHKTILAAVLFSAVALLFGWLSGSWLTDRNIKQLEVQRQTLSAEIESAQTVVAELKKRKLATMPNQSAILTLLEELSWIEDIEIPNAEIDAIQLSVPYQSYTDMIYVLARHDVPYTEQWLPSGRVQVRLQ
ncbi:MAG: hypothetical protein GDA45_00765 [Chromatiales bacterium]|nr:hypothetical protein [Chromatiales bacterium]